MMADLGVPNEASSSRLAGGLKKAGKKRSRVSFLEEEKPPPTRLDVMKQELERMKKRDEELERRQKEYRQNEVRKVRAQLDKERREKGLQLYPNSRTHKLAVKHRLDKETKAAMAEERMLQAAETSRMKNEISLKHGLHVKKSRSRELVQLVQEFMNPDKSSSGLPGRIVRELTLDEILDLKSVFDMFDVGGLGYVRRKDVKTLASVLGFRGSKNSFNEMLDEICADGGKVSFVDFCDFIIKNQEGGDPFDDVHQCFSLMDRDNKGFLNFDDLRRAADEVELSLSNRQIAEMLDDVDTTGNAEVDRDEFMSVMLRTGAFNL